MEDTDAKRQQLTTKYKWVLGLIGAVAISPVIFLAVKGIVGLMIALVVGQVCIQLAPVFSLRLANYKMKLLVGEVEKNPIESMINLRIEKAKELEQADQSIVEFETEIANFDDEIKAFKKRYPEEAPTYQTISEKMHQGLLDMQAERTESAQKLELLEQNIEKAQAIYKMALAAQRVTALSRKSEQAVFQEIKEKVAFDAVRTELNKSFASLNMALRQRQERPALPSKTGAA